MRRFFVRALPELGADVELDDAVLEHVSVLRLQPGASILLFDGSGRLVEATLGEGSARLVREVEVDDDVPFVGLILGLPKKCDDIVRMCTELGVAEIHLALTEHSVPRANPKRLDRLRRIAVQAARQCERARVPQIVAASPLPEVIARVPRAASKMVCWARNDAGGGPDSRVNRDTPRWIAVGPEGGFTDAELEAFDDAGFARVSLGAHVLRVDTAAVVAVAKAVSS